MKGQRWLDMPAACSSAVQQQSNQSTCLKAPLRTNGSLSSDSGTGPHFQDVDNSLIDSSTAVQTLPKERAGKNVC